MTTRPSSIVIRRRACAVCGGQKLDQLIDLPRLPLTALYTPRLPRKITEPIDQVLAACRDCGHVQLLLQVAPSLLYGNEYGFRTSGSPTAKSGTDFFVRSLEDVVGRGPFRCALDIGCNDLHLLERLKDRTQKSVGIDPIWKGREQESHNGISVIGATIEEIDLFKSLGEHPDLILCRHAVEHIFDPRMLLRRLAEAASPGAWFVFEFPGFDALLRKYRFDQVFHQHLNYFNLSGFQRLLLETGLHYVDHRENYHDWGSLLVVFQKTNAAKSRRKPLKAPFSQKEIRSRYDLFRRVAAESRDILRSFKDCGGPLYGYGAAQMLPVLAYHMGTDLSELSAILDDDPARSGWYYQNLEVPIRHPSSAGDLGESTVLITAIDNAKPILTKLFTLRPKHIVFPFHLL